MNSTSEKLKVEKDGPLKEQALNYAMCPSHTRYQATRKAAAADSEVDAIFLFN